MTYKQTYRQLRRHFDLAKDCNVLPESPVAIYNYDFESHAWPILPGARSYRCRAHDVAFEETPQPSTQAPLDVPDVAVEENRRFRYAIFADRRQEKADGAILLFHGLNERDWSKYLPWALRLVETTGKAVVLLPIAFHMNRTPAPWGNPRLMQRVSQERQASSPTIAHSTFANAAISTRLAGRPARFCWSGLQTLADIGQLVDAIRSGQHPRIASSASIDIFGYSIGAFLCEILLMANPGERFTDARLFMFCGGVTLDRMYPNSRYILDSDATIALYSFFMARFENELAQDPRLAHYMSEVHAEGQYFRAMLNYQEQKTMRERRIRELSGQIAAVALRNDAVIPAIEVLNTLQGDFRDIPVSVAVTDFPYEHNHVIPFPTRAPDAELDRCFDEVFDAAANHLA